MISYGETTYKIDVAILSGSGLQGYLWVAGLNRCQNLVRRQWLLHCCIILQRHDDHPEQEDGYVTFRNRKRCGVTSERRHATPGLLFPGRQGSNRSFKSVRGMACPSWSSLGMGVHSLSERRSHSLQTRGRFDTCDAKTSRGERAALIENTS